MEEFLGEASSCSNNKRHVLFLHGENVLSIHGQLVRVEMLSFFGPGNGEGVRSEGSDRRHDEVGVLTRLEGPWSGHIDCNTDCVTWQCFDEGFRSTSISVRESDDPDAAFHKPESDDSVQKSDLRKVGELQMIPDTDDKHDYQGDMEILESLIEGVSKNGAGLNADDNGGDSGLDIVSADRSQSLKDTHNESPHLHGILGKTSRNGGPGISLVTPSNCMGNDLQHNNTSEPSVQQIEGIEGNVKPIDENVVSSSHDE